MLMRMEAPDVRVIVEVADAYAHVALDVIGHGDSNTYSQDGVRDPQRIEIAVAKEEHARDEPPHEGERNEKRIRDMCEGEEQRGQHNGERAIAGHAQKAQQKEILEQELLD